MAKKWQITLDGSEVATGDTATDAFSYDFPSNTTNGDQIYTITVEDENECTATKTVTVKRCETKSSIHVTFRYSNLKVDDRHGTLKFDYQIMVNAFKGDDWDDLYDPSSVYEIDFIYQSGRATGEGRYYFDTYGNTTLCNCNVNVNNVIDNTFAVDGDYAGDLITSVSVDESLSITESSSQIAFDFSISTYGREILEDIRNVILVGYNEGCASEIMNSNMTGYRCNAGDHYLRPYWAYVDMGIKPVITYDASLIPQKIRDILTVSIVEE